MKTLSPFASFERGLKSDHAAEESRKLEVLGIEPGASTRKKPGRPKKDKVGPPPARFMVGVQPELGQQIEVLAEALDTTALAVARMILGAGVEAILRELEAKGGVVVPLRLDVVAEGKGYYWQHLRRVTPERFESLRMFNSHRIEKWRQWRNPADATGTPMPPPASRAAQAG